MEKGKIPSLRQLIEGELERDNLKLPFPDKMAAILAQMLGSEDVSIDRISEIIAKDASLTAKVLNLSNSAFYAGLEKIKTVDRAIARVGLLAIKGFLTASLMKEVFVGKGGPLSGFFTTTWRHSLGCAICAKRIAEELRLRTMAEDAYLLGLVHDIGSVFILNLLNQLQDEREVTPELTREIISAFHAPVGARILEKLNFDEGLCRIVAAHHDQAPSAEQESQLFHILQVANQLMQKLGVSLTPDQEVSIISLPSTGKLGLEPLFIAVLEVDIEEILSTMDELL